MTTTSPERHELENADDEAAGTEAPSTRLSSLLSLVAGALGAALALSVGELFDAVSDSIISMVSAIGDVVIEITPGELVAESINTIGTAQKPALQWGISITALLVGAALGFAGRRRRWVVPAGFGAFGILGGFAGARSELTDAAGSWAVAIISAIVGAVLTLWLLRTLDGPEVAAAPATADGVGAPIVPGSPFSQAADRRKFLAFGGAALGTAAVFATGRRAGGPSAAEQAREAILTEGTPSATASTGSGTSVDAGPWMPTTGDFDHIDGITDFITPISPRDEFYLIDTALTKPQVDPATWSLTIDGFVENELTFTYDELMAREMVEREVTLSCVSNPVGGDLVGNAHWRGIPLTELLDEAGVDPNDTTTQVFMRSVDGFTCGFPTHLAYDGRTAMLALEMNGEPLPIKHGFPARMVVAGLYGYVSATKWIESISITDWEGVDGFWMPRGWSKEGPIKTQSRIDVPRHRSRVPAGPVTLGGIAWSPTVGIARVEVGIDDEPWAQAELAVVESNETWVQWKYDWDAPLGDHVVRVRAMDKNGFIQSPIEVAPAPNGAEGHHTIQVRMV